MIKPEEVELYEYIVSSFEVTHEQVHKIVVCYPEEVLKLLRENLKLQKEIERMKQFSQDARNLIWENMSLRDEVRYYKKQLGIK